MNDKIKLLFEQGHYKLANKLMLSQSIEMIDIDINKLLHESGTKRYDDHAWRSGLIANRTHDFTIEIMSNIPDGSFWSVWICDFRGEYLSYNTVKEYGDLLTDNPTYCHDIDECWLIAVSKQGVLNLLFKQPIFKDENY